VTPASQKPASKHWKAMLTANNTLKHITNTPVITTPYHVPDSNAGKYTED